MAISAQSLTSGGGRWRSPPNLSPWEGADGDLRPISHLWRGQMVVDGLHVTCMHHMHMHTLHAVHGSRVRAQPSQQASKPVRGARWRVLRREANDVLAIQMMKRKSVVLRVEHLPKGKLELTKSTYLLCVVGTIINFGMSNVMNTLRTPTTTDRLFSSRGHGHQGILHQRSIQPGTSNQRKRALDVERKGTGSLTALKAKEDQRIKIEDIIRRNVIVKDDKNSTLLKEINDISLTRTH